MNKRYEPSEDVAGLIIEKYKNGVSGGVLATDFNISKPTLYNFLRRNGIMVQSDTESKNARYGIKREIIVSSKPYNDFYVYLHKDLDGLIFYVGKGRNNRCNDKSNRGIAWKNKAQHGYTVEIYSENLDETSALDLETKLIIELKGIVNKTPASKLVFTQGDYSQYFAINSNTDSGLVRTNAVWTGNHLKGKIGNTGYVSERYGKKYWRVKFKNKSVMVHRIIWTIAYGDIPDNQVVDHIDGNGLNNKSENLRIVSKSTNCKNKTLNKNNSTGQTGVYRFTDDNLSGYKSIVIENGNRKSKRFYDHKHGKEEAFRLACEWRKEQIRLLNEQGAGYTERHGT